VPDVVGKATKYGSGLFDGPHLGVIPDIFEDVALVGGGDTHHFGDVQRSATTEADDAVGSMGFEMRPRRP
jgi:hypothetical protein